MKKPHIKFAHLTMNGSQHQKEWMTIFRMLNRIYGNVENIDLLISDCTITGFYFDRRGLKKNSVQREFAEWVLLANVKQRRRKEEHAA